MTTTNILPNGTVTSSGTITNIGGAGSFHAAVSDGSDSTYLQIDYATSAFVVFDFATFPLPAGAVVLQVTNKFRLGVNGSGALAYRYGTASIPSPQPATATPTTYSNTASTDSAGQSVSTQAHIDGYQMLVSYVFSPYVFLYEVSVDVKYATVPTATASGPTGTITTTLSPTATWAHTPGSDAVTGQTKYQVRVFTAAQFGIGGFDPATSPSSYDSGQVAGAVTSAVVGPLANSTTYRAYVRTAQTTLGVDQWSAFSFSGFSTSVTTSDITSVVGSNLNSTARNQIVVTRNTGTPTWTILEVQSSYDGGTTWTYVRGYTAFAIPTQAVTAAAATDLVNLTAHGLSAGNTVVFSGLTGGAGLVAGTTYFVIASGLTANSFKVSTTSGGSAVDITSDMTAGSMQSALTITLYDYEAPNGTACLYRARASYVSGGVITGAWVSSSATTWSGTDLWLKDITTPARNVIVYNVLMPEPGYDRQVGVFRPLGAIYPVVVADVRQAGVSSITVETYTAADETALKLLCSTGTVLLLQAPTTTGFGWGNRYVVVTSLQEQRMTQETLQEWRQWVLGLVEVDRPADTGIN